MLPAPPAGARPCPEACCDAIIAMWPACSSLPDAAGGVLWVAFVRNAIASGQADLVALARAFLDDPRWVWHAAETLGETVSYPPQYARVQAKLWPGAALARPPLELAKHAATGD